MMLVMVMIGLIGILSNMMLRILWYRGGRRGRVGGRGGAALVLAGIIFAIIAPIMHLERYSPDIRRVSRMH